MRVVCCVVAAAASTSAPAAAAHRFVAVGYRTPSALHGLRVVSRVDALRVAEVRVASPRQARALRRRAGIRYVAPVVARRRAGGPSLGVPGSTAVPEWQWTATHEDAVPQWVQQAASRVTIAVVDTGADLTVPSLADKHATTWDVVDGSGEVRDEIGHGTFVASLAAASTTNADALLGFGGDAKLMIVQANRGTDDFSDVDEANAIVWAVDHGANVVNLSLGGTRTSLVERSAIDYAIGKGVLLVAAAGNSAQQGNPTMYPAALIGDRGLVVGAADAGGRRAAFSSTGGYVDLLAPGVDVVGALPAGVTAGLFSPVTTPGATGTYGVGSGTSYAAPEVAGAAALVMAANPSLDALGVARTLEATAAGSGTWTNGQAWGDLDVAAAVTRAAGGPAPVLAMPAQRTRSISVKPVKATKTAPAGKKRPKGKKRG